MAAIASTAYSQIAGFANDDFILVNAANYAGGVSGNLITDDVITGGYTLELSWTNPQGSLTLSASDGSYSYVPPPGFSGIDRFTYKFCYVIPGAPNLCSNDANVTVDIEPNPQPDTFTGSVNQPLHGNVGTNDPYPGLGGVAYTFEATSQPPASAGTLTLLDPATGAFTFTPTSSFIGTTSFNYQICATYSFNRNVCAPSTARIRIAAAAGAGNIEAIPAVSVWGLMALSPLVVGAASYARRRKNKRTVPPKA